MTAENPDRLDAAKIRAGMGTAASASLAQLTLLQEVDSTNAWLLRAPFDQQHAHAVLADRQSEGRGRRQRRWHSPGGGNIHFSLGWRFGKPADGLATLPLLVGICLCRVLAQAGLEGHGIKWPNDILVTGRKLAGILVEMQSMPDGPALAVIGIGVNVRMPQSAAGEADALIDRPWTDLASNRAAGRPLPDRNRLVAQLLDALLPELDTFQARGFAAYLPEWGAWDLLAGGPVTLNVEGRAVSGRSRGIDDSGGLRLEQENGEVHVYHSGEVSVSHV
jgi:BirA family biotin operon repressor/biotin-[acetyl-CoA-carboxylase] ligase